MLYVVSYKKKFPDSEKNVIFFPDSLSKIGVTHALNPQRMLRHELHSWIQCFSNMSYVIDENSLLS